VICPRSGALSFVLQAPHQRLPAKRKSGESLSSNPDAGHARITRKELALNGKILPKQVRLSLAPARLCFFRVVTSCRILRQEKTERGQTDILPSSGMKDDLAIAVALGASELAKQPPAPAPMQLGIININPLGLVPGVCPNEAVCANFPTCLDLGGCQWFEDERVSV
jgi:hypothetical protein